MRETNQSVTQGEDTVVLAYGPARSGKTHTLEGSGGVHSDRAGVLLRAMRAISAHLAIVPSQQYRMHVTACGERLVTGTIARHATHGIILLDPVPLGSAARTRACWRVPSGLVCS